ncbi:MAG TPA: hypothetical protein VJQ79_08050 [Acidimicrobiia bacterium]|nr:hypothetical protein [Acidimicrobiia bacterium]
MPITDPAIPLQVLESLTAADVRFAVLHKEELLGSRELDSDVDLVVDVPAPEALHRTSSAFEDLGLRAALLWPYDLGGTTTVFVTTSNGDQGAQIDFLFDPTGRGRYGIRTDVMLGDVGTGRRFPVPGAVDQQLYLIRKGACKGQPDRVEAGLAGLARLSSTGDAIARARVLFSPRAGTEMVRLLAGGATTAKPAPNRPVGNAWRRARRVVRPIGLWAEIVGSEERASAQAARLEDRFGRWLVHTDRARRVRGAAGILWWIRQVAPVRFRPGLFLSWAEAPSWPPADVTLAAPGPEGIDRAAAAIVDAFASKNPT